MIYINNNNKEKCCGCTACANICPKGAITMEEDFEGFLYPIVDKEKCINCGLCDRVCPIINKNKNRHNDKVNSYAIRSVDKNNLENSTSGGFFTPLAKYILEHDGIVSGVIFDEKDKMIKHISIGKNEMEKIELFRGSKYVQSYLGNIFKDIRNYLQEQRWVLFSGTPCQVEGLLRFLGKKYDNLITVDLICHGVPSPKLWKEYVDYQEKKYKSKIKSVNFRNKTYGYHSGTMKLLFENGKRYYGSARVDYMLKSFFSEISSRPSCYKCKFKDKYHLTDFTIFDSWHAGDLNKGIEDDDKGFTNLFINSIQGRELFEKVRDNYSCFKTNMNMAIDLDGAMVQKSASPNINRNEYYYYLNNNSLNSTIQKFIKVKKIDYLIERSKIIMYRLKVLKLLKSRKDK